MSDYFLSTRSLERIATVDDRLKRLADLAIKITKIDFGIPEHGGLRTEEEQKALFAKGVSQCDGVIKKSRHQSGRAVDFYAYVNGRASWEKKDMAMIAAAFLQAAAMLEIPCQWGGLWEYNDMPHIELLEE